MTITRDLKRFGAKSFAWSLTTSLCLDIGLSKQQVNRLYAMYYVWFIEIYNQEMNDWVGGFTKEMVKKDCGK